ALTFHSRSETDMTSVVPQPNHRLSAIVFVAQRAEACRAEQEVSAGCRFEPQPAGGQNSQEMPAGKKQHITADLANSIHHGVGPRGNLLGRLSSWAAIA